jgi:hypothetical protein
LFVLFFPKFRGFFANFKILLKNYKKLIKKFYKYVIITLQQKKEIKKMKNINTKQTNKNKETNKQNFTINEFYKILKIAGLNDLMKIIKNNSSTSFDILDFKNDSRTTKLRVTKYNKSNMVKVELFKKGFKVVSIDEYNLRTLLIEYIDLKKYKLYTL